MIAEYIERLKDTIGEENYKKVGIAIFKKIDEAYPGVQIDKALKIAEINIKAVIDVSRINFEIYDENVQLKELLKWSNASDYDFLLIKDIKELKKLYIE